jgi:hypothetical protein
MGDHYVSKFLLPPWATDGQMVSYSWDPHRKAVREDTRAGLNKHCAIRGLNNLRPVGDNEERSVEDYFTQEIDTPAAVAHRTMLKSGIRALTPTDCQAWARFIVALPVRSPETLLNAAPVEAERALRDVENIGWGSREDHAVANGRIRRDAGKHRHNLPRLVARGLSRDPDKLNRVLEMKWSISRWERRAILIGDRPLITQQRTRLPWGIPLDDPQCLIALPISPDAVFVATFDLKSQNKRRISQWVASLTS